MRSNLISVLLIIVAMANAGCGEKKAEKTEKGTKRNFILITLDTVRADHIGAWGYEKARTPNIDRLADNGVKFVNAVSTAPITMPSHSSIMTGLYPHHHGVRNNGAFQLDPKATTLAERFKDAGYDTGAVIAAMVLDSKFGLDQGFRIYDDDLYAGEKQIQFMFKEIIAEKVTDKAIAMIEGGLKEPFFLWIHYFDPHANYNPPPPYDMLFLEQPYDGEIAYVDKQLGRFLEALDSKELGQNTEIFLTADHGDSLGDHGEMTHGIFIYRSTTHVPFVVSGSDISPRVVSDIVSGVDIAPTIVDMAGLEPLQSIDGLSLASSIMSGVEVPKRDGVLMESANPRFHFGWHELRAIETGSRKYIQAPKQEYYELNHDPLEKNNLWTTHEKEAEPLKKSLENSFGDDDLGEIQLKNVDSETKQMLVALGYMSDVEVKVEKDVELPDPKDMAGDWQVLQQCQQLVRMKQFEEAEPCLKKVLETSPSNWPASLSLVSVYTALGKSDKAEEVLANAIKIDPDNVKALENLAALQIEEKRFNEAEKTYKQAAASGKRDPEPWTLLGDMYQTIGKPKSAMEAYSEALKCDEIYVKAYVGLANTFHKANSSDRALRYLQEAIKIDPKNHAAWFNMGVVQDSLKNSQEAEKAYRKAAELEPNHAMTYNNLGSLLHRLGRNDEAKAAFKQALAADPNHVESMYNMATLLIESEPEIAVSMLNKAISLNPGLIPAHTNLAYAYQKLDKLDEAMVEFQWIVNRMEKAPGIYLSMARLEMKRGRKPAARGYVKKAIEQDGKRAREKVAMDPVLKPLL